MSESERRNDIINKANEIFLKVAELLDRELPTEMTVEEGVNASCIVGLGIIKSNLIHCNTNQEREEMANILISHCINAIEECVNDLDTRIPNQNSKMIILN